MFLNPKGVRNKIPTHLHYVINLRLRACFCGSQHVSASLIVPVLFQGYEGVRESLGSKKNSACTVKSVDSNMNTKSRNKKEEEIELPGKKNQDLY